MEELNRKVDTIIERLERLDTVVERLDRLANVVELLVARTQAYVAPPALSADAPERERLNQLMTEAMTVGITDSHLVFLEAFSILKRTGAIGSDSTSDETLNGTRNLVERIASVYPQEVSLAATMANNNYRRFDDKNVLESFILDDDILRGLFRCVEPARIFVEFVRKVKLITNSPLPENVIKARVSAEYKWMAEYCVEL
ncbi:hypothetical protein HDU85_005841 [Gaertneriomyces sp. JEL0708]|nr:hypothetical protein HDU85_005841 [Gaertneriomyces sp. JEL0708]